MRERKDHALAGWGPRHKSRSRRTGYMQMLTQRPHSTQGWEGEGDREDGNQHCLTEAGFLRTTFNDEQALSGWAEGGKNIPAVEMA